MVKYLESVHMDEFITGSLEDVKRNLDIAELDDQYKNPTETLPIPPPLVLPWLGLPRLRLGHHSYSKLGKPSRG